MLSITNVSKANLAHFWIIAKFDLCQILISRLGKRVQGSCGGRVGRWRRRIVIALLEVLSSTG